MSKIIYSSEEGLSPRNSAWVNSDILGKIVSRGGEIVIDEPGIYDICKTCVIPSDTHITFCAGTYIRRSAGENGEEFSYVFCNRGAYDKTTDSHIHISGMRLIVNGLDLKRELAQIYGLNGHLSFFYVNDLVIEDFECLDVQHEGFCIHVCAYENLRVENVRIEGKKDGIHLGWGRKFRISHGIFRTYDDPIALNAHDYETVGTPELGWIEDGLIEDCYDLDDESTSGFFCRILSGSWTDWREGMEIQNSDTVIYGGRLYRATIDTKGTVIHTEYPPTHLKGRKDYGDGILWTMTQDKNITYNCGCRRIHFRDIFLMKKRPIAFSVHLDRDVYSRSCYPYSDYPVSDDLIFENIFMENDIPVLLKSTAPVGNIKLINSVIQNSAVLLAHRGTEGLVYPEAYLSVIGATLRGRVVIKSVEGRKLNLRISSGIAEKDSSLSLMGEVKLLSCDTDYKII